ncbi:MAG TPA: PTS galactitol transporter subunit IIC, partial [Clostridiaceae bacterium]|nr:PTS galactitol transporter subunit IIC [Clostridiaceae bacterium]
MEVIYSIFNVIMKAGATVMLPIIITIVGLIFGLKLSRAFR